MSNCMQCGRPVPEYKKDETLLGGTVRRKGTRAGSSAMVHLDPDKMFCRLRCAAKYGIAAARKVKRK